MKKILTYAIAALIAVSANAQKALETAKLFDNTYVGISVGATTPLDFNSVFPVNPNVGLKFGKDLTPVVGLQLEGLAILNDNHFTDVKTALKATNVGANMTVNWSNLLFGYKGTPRVFEIGTVAGLGWLHTWDTPYNYVTAKTGVDLAFNLGKNKAHSLVITPAVYWNMDRGGHFEFNKGNAQLALSVGYVYHFKVSNGTHSFKMYDIAAYENEITALKAELAKKPTEVVKTVEVVREVKTTVVENNTRNYVTFAQNSYELTETAKNVLDGITEGSTVAIEATASPEGTAEYNKGLSERRAKAVADYLTGRGVNVKTVSGLGVTGEDSQRVAIVSYK